MSAVSLIALAAAALFAFQTEQQISNQRAAARLFDLRAAEVERAIADVRAAQQAYVAAGQSLEVWAPKVATVSAGIAAAVDELRASASSAAARAALMSAAATAIEIGNVDRRAREYLTDGQQLMAADVLFSDAEGTTTLAAGQVMAARAAEYEELERVERAQRLRQASALAAAGGLTAVMLLLLGFPAGPAAVESGTSSRSVEAAVDEPAGSAFPGLHHDLPRQTAPVLKAAAEVCTDLGRVADVDDLTALLGKAAELMDASGLLVWLGSTSGGDLRPVVAHGYSPQTLARMPAVTRQADNAAAAAYRSGALQIVLARPGASNGAVVAPLLTPDGCIGALTAEIKGRSETSDTTQALAAIFAAQLASVLASSTGAAATAADSRTDKVASA